MTQTSLLLEDRDPAAAAESLYRCWVRLPDGTRAWCGGLCWRGPTLTGVYLTFVDEHDRATSRELLEPDVVHGLVATSKPLPLNERGPT